VPEARLGLAAVVAVLVLVGCGTGSADKPAERSATPSGSTPSWGSSSPSAAAASKGVPERLAIPRLDVDAEVLALGTAADGSQEVPTRLDATAWWSDGGKPGGSGNTVIVGHTSSKSAGVFDELGALRRGDRVTVRARHGSVDYVVTKTSEVRVEKFPTVSESIYSETGPSGLVLMTCGDWNGRDYDTTVIVRAVHDG
jgi:LPXTG-site transpeptidase (sortase) family protein